MVEDRADRRLAAILAADIAGYSQLMSVDEEGTLRQLKAHRKELIDPKITAHRGRVVKTTGDGMLSLSRPRFDRVTKEIDPHLYEVVHAVDGSQ
jgi:adenylate cyclase